MSVAGIRLVSAVLLCPTAVLAARPMITDDARIVEAKACQLETWVRRNEGSTEYWAIPACNPTGNFELAVGGGRTREGGETHTSDVQIQGKTVFKALEKNGWGIGLAIGYLRHPGEGRSSDLGRGAYGYIPASFSFSDDSVVLHVNAGAQRPENETRHRLTWGAGAEIQLHRRLFFIPEIFKQEQGRPHFQAGFRYWLVPERLQFDATYGDRLGTSNGQRWISIGMRVITPAFLP